MFRMNMLSCRESLMLWRSVPIPGTREFRAHTRPDMLTTDPRTMNLVALGMAKITYGALKILQELCRELGDGV